MVVQTLIVGVLVLGCALFSTWTLMPAGGRRRLAQRLLKLRLPESIHARLRRHAQATGGCGCDGCDQGSKAPTGGEAKPIQFHRRLPR